MIVTWHFSINGGWQSTDIHKQVSPDAVPVTDDERAALLAEQSKGKVIRPGADGRPVAVDPPAADPAIARRTAIAARLAAIDLLSVRPLRAVAAGAATDDDRTRLKALDDEAAGLRVELAALNQESTS